MADFPCKDCQKRYLGCHSQCTLYNAAKNEQEKEKNMKEKDKLVRYAGIREAKERMKKVKNPNRVWRINRKSA